METRVNKQVRAIRKYAKVLNVDLEQAAKQWVENGLAARWAEQN